MDAIVVDAEERDAERLAAVSALAKETYRRWAGANWFPPSIADEAQHWRERFADRCGWVAVALEDEQAVGAVSITAARTDGGRGEEVPGVAHLGRMFVHPQYWGQGIGGALLLRAVSEMQQRGYRTAQLYTAARNVRSRRFYERHGWRSSQEDAERQHEGLAVVRYTVELSA